MTPFLFKPPFALIRLVDGGVVGVWANPMLFPPPIDSTAFESVTQMDGETALRLSTHLLQIIDHVSRYEKFQLGEETVFRLIKSAE
jgi:hypothetical protein